MHHVHIYCYAQITYATPTEMIPFTITNSVASLYFSLGSVTVSLFIYQAIFRGCFDTKGDVDLDTLHQLDYGAI